MGFLEFCDAMHKESDELAKRKSVAGFYNFICFILAMITVPVVIHLLASPFFPAVKSLTEQIPPLWISLNILYYIILFFVGFITYYFIYPIYYFILYRIIAPLLAIGVVVAIIGAIVWFLKMYFTNGG